MDMNINIMTEEEKKNPSKVMKRVELQESQISVYFGSHKEELAEACLTCKKKDKCNDYKEILMQRQIIKDNAYNPFIGAELSKEERDKVANNDYIIINCHNKEEC